MYNNALPLISLTDEGLSIHPSQVCELEVFVVGRGLEAGPRDVGRQPHTLVPEPLRQLRSLYHLVTVYCIEV